MQDSLDGIRYKEEHLMCENYISDEHAIWKVVELHKSEIIVRESLERSTLVFVMSGKLEISTDDTWKQEVGTQKMFLIPVGGYFYGNALEDTVLLCCLFTLGIALCNKFSINQLKYYIKPEADVGQRTALLPIHPLLFKEVEITHSMLKAGLSCIHYQRMKMEIVFIELRGFYQREELALLFAPVFGEDDDFKSKVMQLYSQVDTVKELCNRLNMSSSCFKRKFYDTFGTSAKQWMIQKKKMKLLRDVIMSKMSIAELAEKYKFTANYLTAFCKEHFGKSPTELRADCMEGVKWIADNTPYI